MKKEKAITLISLVVTIIILIILASVSINILLGDNGIIKMAKKAKESTEIEAIKEELKMYILHEEMNNHLGGINDVKEKYPLAVEKNGEYATLKNTLTQDEINNLSEDLRVKLYQLEKKVSTNQDFTINDTTYEIFYKLDENKIKSAKKYKDKLYLYITNNEYNLIYLDGFETEEGIAYSILPMETSVKAEYFTAGNNTYKLLKGTLKSIGQKNTFSGFTSTELNEYTKWQELDLAKLSDNKIAEPIKQELFINNTAFLIDNNNILWAWGDNSNNKLGLGNSYTQLKPVKIFENAKQVWGGLMNTFVLDQEGNLWGAGSNTNSTLGQNNSDIYQNFVKIEGIDGNKIVKVLPSHIHESSNAIIYTSDKKIYGLGYIAQNMINITCKQITDLSTKSDLFKDVDDVAFHGQCMYILKEGILYGIGRTQDTALAVTGHGNTSANIPYTSPKQLATNVSKMRLYTYLTNEGHLYYVCDGNGECKFRQVYWNDDTPVQNTNSIIQEYGTISTYNVSTPVSQKVIIDGKSYSFSYNSSKNRVYLVQYTSYSNLSEIRAINTNVVKTTSGKYYTSDSLISNGTNLTQLEFRDVNINNKNIIFGQGSNKYINLIDKDYNVYKATNNGYELDKVGKVKKVLSSDSGVVVLTQDGKVYRKGTSNYGGTGDSNYYEDYKSVINEQKEQFGNVKDIAHSLKFQFATLITENNELYYIGHRSYTHLPNKTGTGTFASNGIPLYPVKIESEKLKEILPKYHSMAVNCSAYNSIQVGATYIVTTDGELYSYGKSQLTGTATEPSDFVKVTLPDKVKQIKTQDGYTIVLLENGEVYAWGYNTYGQFGTGQENIGKLYATPIKLAIDWKVTNFALGEGFAIFELFDGRVVGAGKNEYGQLGTGNTISTSIFVRCKNLED